MKLDFPFHIPKPFTPSCFKEINSVTKDLIPVDRHIMYGSYRHADNYNSMCAFVSNSNSELIYYEYGDNQEYVSREKVFPMADFSGFTDFDLATCFMKSGGIKSAFVLPQSFRDFCEFVSKQNIGVSYWFNTQRLVIQSDISKNLSDLFDVFQLNIPGCKPLFWPAPKADFETGVDETVIWFKCKSSDDCLQAGFIPLSFMAWKVADGFHLAMNSLVVIDTQRFSLSFPSYYPMEAGAIIDLNMYSERMFSICRDHNRIPLPPDTYVSYKFGIVKCSNDAATKIMIDPAPGGYVRFWTDRAGAHRNLVVLRERDIPDVLVKQAEAKRRTNNGLTKFALVEPIIIDQPVSLSVALDIANASKRHRAVLLDIVVKVECENREQAELRRRMISCVGDPGKIPDELKVEDVDEAEDIRMRVINGELTQVPIASCMNAVTCPVTNEIFEPV